MLTCEAVLSPREYAIQAGETTFLKLTPHDCGGYLFYVRRGKCVKCHKSRVAKCRIANPSRAKELAKKYRDADPVAHATRCSEWRSRNKNLQRKLSDNWAAANKERLLVARDKYRLRNKERIALAHAVWGQENRDRVIIHNANRRGRENGGRITREEVADLLIKQRGRCAYYRVCGVKFKRGNFHRDHVLPLARGGPNIIANIQLLCPRCNMRKHAKDPISFARQIGFLI